MGPTLKKTNVETDYLFIQLTTNQKHPNLDESMNHLV